MTEDWLGFEDPAERQAARGPALMIPAKMGPRELRVAEEMHRLDDAPAANRLIFTETDDVTGKEIWARRALGDQIDEGQRWRTIMQWPVVPSIEAAQAAKSYAIAARLAKWWDRLREARALDERLGYDSLDDVPPKVGSKP